MIMIATTELAAAEAENGLSYIRSREFFYNKIKERFDGLEVRICRDELFQFCRTLYGSIVVSPPFDPSDLDVHVDMNTGEVSFTLTPLKRLEMDDES